MLGDSGDSRTLFLEDLVAYCDSLLCFALLGLVWNGLGVLVCLLCYCRYF